VLSFTASGKASAQQRVCLCDERGGVAVVLVEIAGRLDSKLEAGIAPYSKLEAGIAPSFGQWGRFSATDGSRMIARP
jgi:hypothetical protein